MSGSKPVCQACGQNIDRKKSWLDGFASDKVHTLAVYCPNIGGGGCWTGQVKQSKTRLGECSKYSCPTVSTEEGKSMSRVNIASQLEAYHKEKKTHELQSQEPCQEAEQDTSQQFCYLEDQENELTVHEKIVQKTLEACYDSVDNGKPRMDSTENITSIQSTKIQDLTENRTSHMDLESEAIQHVGWISDVTLTLLVQHEVRSKPSKIDSQLDEEHQLQRLCQAQAQEISQGTNVLENDLTELAANQELMQQKTLEACYWSVDSLQKGEKAKMESFQHQQQGLKEKCIEFQKIISMLSARLQAQDQVLAALDIKLAEHSLQDRLLAVHDIKLIEHSVRLDLMDCRNPEGVFLWKITEIRRLTREAVSGKTPSIYSQSFYTCANGYKMCVKLYLNGDGIGRGTHLSLFFVVMRGDYDFQLPWPFKQKVTMVLIDQDGRHHIADNFTFDQPSSSFEKPHSHMNIAMGCPQFVSIDILDDGRYIKEDTMFIKVLVDSTILYQGDS